MKAQSLARGRGHQQIDAVHLLYSLLSQEESIVLTLLKTFQVDIEDLTAKTDRALAQIPLPSSAQGMKQFYLTQDLAQVIQAAREEAMKMGDGFISVEHLFLGLLALPSRAQSVLQNVRFRGGAVHTPLNREIIVKKLDEISQKLEFNRMIGIK